MYVGVITLSTFTPLKLEAHESWGVRLVVPDVWLYVEDVNLAKERRASLSKISTREGFTSTNLLNTDGETPKDKDEIFPPHPTRYDASIIIRKLQADEDIFKLIKKEIYE